MSVSISEVLDHADYTLDNRADCEWLLAQEAEWQELTNQAEQWLGDEDDRRWELEQRAIESICACFRSDVEEYASGYDDEELEQIIDNSYLLHDKPQDCPVWQEEQAEAVADQLIAERGE